LARFYDSWAVVEIDEYGKYEKAISAWKNALKYAVKSNHEKKEEKKQQLESKIFLVNKFLKAKSLEQSDPEEMVRMLKNLIEKPIDYALRIGDVYAVLIKHYHKENNTSDAYQLIQELTEKGQQPEYYIEKTMIDEICSSMGVVQEKPKDDEVFGQDFGEMDEDIGASGDFIEEDIGDFAWF